MTIGEIIKRRRKELGISAEILAERTKISPATIYRYENGTTANPKSSLLHRIGDALGIDLIAYLSWDEFDDMIWDEITPPQREKLPSNLTPISKAPRHKVPLIGSVAAGEPIIADAEFDVYVDIPEDADYALTVEGDSMEPLYLNGDMIYIKIQDDVDDGRVAVVLMDDTAALKHVYHAPNGLLLVSENTKYPPRNITFDDFDVIRILGIPVGFTRMYRRKD